MLDYTMFPDIAVPELLHDGTLPEIPWAIARNESLVRLCSEPRRFHVWRATNMYDQLLGQNGPKLCPGRIERSAAQRECNANQVRHETAKQRQCVSAYRRLLVRSASN